MEFADEKKNQFCRGIEASVRLFCAERFQLCFGDRGANFQKEKNETEKKGKHVSFYIFMKRNRSLGLYEFH